MSIKVIPPEEGKERVREKVAQWKMDKERIESLIEKRMLTETGRRLARETFLGTEE